MGSMVPQYEKSRSFLARSGDRTWSVWDRRPASARCLHPEDRPASGFQSGSFQLVPRHLSWASGQILIESWLENKLKVPGNFLDLIQLSDGTPAKEQTFKIVGIFSRSRKQEKFTGMTSRSGKPVYLPYEDATMVSVAKKRSALTSKIWENRAPSWNPWIKSLDLVGSLPFGRKMQGL